MLDSKVQRQQNDKEYLIGLDIGTSAAKGVLMAAEGTLIARQTYKIDYYSLPDGCVQFDVKEFYQSIVYVIRRLVTELPKDGLVVGISMASASGNTLLVSSKDEPMIDVISWLDSRADNEIKQVFGDLKKSEVHELIGWPLLPAFPLAHISWLKCHQPKLLQNSARICMSTEYINFKLTGNWGIDPSTATTFYLQDQRKAKWHQPYLQKLGIPISKLPPIYDSGTVLGHITSTAAAETGLSTGTPVVLGAFDHPCAARGAGVTEEGALLLSCGTSWVGFSPQKDREKAIEQGLLVDPFLQSEDLWGTMFSLPAIATIVDKFIKKYISNSLDLYEKFSELSASSSPGAGGLIIDPMNEDVLKSLEGYAKADVARAIMEGTAFLLKRKIDQLESVGIHFSSIVMVGGPSETYPWPQIVSDVLGKEIDTINGSSAGAVGAAILAGKGVGIYTDERDAFQKATFSKLNRKPDKATHQLYMGQYQKFINRYD